MRKKFFSWIFLIINLLFIVNLIREIVWLSKAGERIKKTQNRFESLRQENFYLKQEKAYRESDEFAEKQIRDKLGMAKPEEYVVLLPREAKSKLEDAEESEKELANWRRWYNLFFN